jgi:4-aminobutyrate aminotransferase-like enzyme
MNRLFHYRTSGIIRLLSSSETVGDVRGKGVIIGVELIEDKQNRKPTSQKAAEVILRSWKRGDAIINCGNSTLRVAPPLAIQRELWITRLAKFKM